jgi:C-terminal processing protease CtpA/Prc
MLRRTWVAVVAVLALAAAPLYAGEHHSKCTMSTQDCLDHMAAKMKSGGWVGVELDQNEETGTLTVLKVVPGSPAESAGIQPGDILYALNGVQINKDNEEKLQKVRKEWQPGQSVNYTLKRNGADKQVTLTLAPMPADVLARYIGQHMLEHASADIAKN